MHLCLLIIGFVLFPQVYTLNCFTCIGGSCSETQCFAEKNQCGATKMITYNGSAVISDFKYRSCYNAPECIQGSINLGSEKVVFTSECCSLNLCNNKDAPDPPKTKPNGKKCYRCHGNGDCNGTLNCEGDEDQCIKGSGATSMGWVIKGCATKSICLAIDLSIPGISRNISCCEGNYCNGVNGLSSSPLLVTMLMSIFFLSH